VSRDQAETGGINGNENGIPLHICGLSDTASVVRIFGFFVNTDTRYCPRVDSI